jgi:hypothetical protein
MDGMSKIFATYPQYVYSRICFKKIDDDDKEVLFKLTIKIINTNIIAKLQIPDKPMYSVKYSFKYLLDKILAKNVEFNFKNEIPEHALITASKNYDITIFVISDINIKRFAHADVDADKILCCYQSPDSIYFELCLTLEEIDIIKKHCICVDHHDEKHDDHTNHDDRAIHVIPQIKLKLIPTPAHVPSQKQLLRLKLNELQDIVILKGQSILGLNNKKLKKEELVKIIMK